MESNINKSINKMVVKEKALELRRTFGSLANDVINEIISVSTLTDVETQYWVDVKLKLMLLK